MYYWATNKQFRVETALLQFLSNLGHSFSEDLRRQKRENMGGYFRYVGLPLECNSVHYNFLKLKFAVDFR